MKIALILKGEKIDDPPEDTIPIIILHTDNNIVTDVEKDMIVKKDINYLALWLLTRHIKEIYVMDIDPMVEMFFEKLGVTTKRYEDIAKNPALKKFVS